MDIPAGACSKTHSANLNPEFSSQPNPGRRLALPIFRSHINTIMDAKPEGLYSVEWAGELISMMKQANQAGMFDKIKHVMLPVGAAMDVLEGLGAEMPDNIWISGRYFFLYPDNAQNNRLGGSFPEAMESLSCLRF